MPELAENAVYAKDINIISNKKLISFKLGGEKKWQKKIIQVNVINSLKNNLNSSVIFESEGKSLFLTLKNNERIHFKLGMTGMFQIKKPSVKNLKHHNFLTLNFSDNTSLYYLDFRRFSRVTIEEKKENLFIGGFNPTRGFYLKTKKELKSIIKYLRGFNSLPKITWLLKHGKNTGIGNYLANESCGLLNLNPFTPCKNEAEAISLLKKCALISKKSFSVGGNSFKGGYFRLTGEKGLFINYCKFYKNKNVNCYIFQGRPVFTNYKNKTLNLFNMLR